MARPSKLTPEVLDRVLAAIAAGASQEVAARHGGIAPSTHFDWMRRGREALERARTPGRPSKADAAYAEYSEQVEAGLRAFELEQLAQVAIAAAGAPYETVRVVEKQEVVGKDEDGTPILATTRTTTTERGAKRDWRAAAQLLKWRRPAEYGDRLDVTGKLSPEQQAELITRAVEGVLSELGVAQTPAVGQVVARHLTLVADDADRMAV